jgi:hypothetical protein
VRVIETRMGRMGPKTGEAKQGSYWWYLIGVGGDFKFSKFIYCKRPPIAKDSGKYEPQETAR